MKRIIFILTGIAILAVRAETKVPPFEAGERVAFIGDSITHGGSYHVYVQAFYATRFPERKVACFNVGVSSDGARGGSERSSAEGDGIWENDVRTYKPTAAAIMLGMNDAGGNQFQECGSRAELEVRNATQSRWYHDRYIKMLDNLEKQGLKRIILIKSSPYDQTLTDPAAKANLYKFGIGKNDVIVRLGKDVLDAESVRRGYPVIDFNTPMLEINARQQAVNPAFSIIGKDRIHPGEDGHMIMAYVFLKSQGLEGPVATVAIDAGKAKVDSAANCSVEKLERNGSGVRFEYLAKALPFPRSPYQSVASLIPFESEFNQESLTVSGLTDGTYTLKIDGVALGRFSASELASGVNLAVLDQAPQVIQANEVLKLCGARAQLAQKIRAVVWSVGWLRMIEGLDMDDVPACKQMVARIMAGEKPKGFRSSADSRFNTYAENADQYDRLLKELDAMIGPLCVAAQPRMHVVEIGPPS